MASTVLRRPSILPLFNLYTIGCLLVLAYLALSVYLGVIWKGGTGIEYLYYLMLLQMVPIVVAFTRRHFTYLSLIMVFHFVQLSLPKWLTVSDNPASLENFPEIVSAFQEQLFCTAIIILVYFAARRFLFSTVPEKERFQLLTLTRSQAVTLSCYVVFVPMFLAHLPAWFLSIHFLLLSADLVLLFSSHSPGNQGILIFTKFAAIVGAGVYFLNTGMMTLMGALVSIISIMCCLRKRFRLLSVCVLAVVLMSAVQTVKGPFRIIIADPIENYSTFERLGILWELLYLKYFDDMETDIDQDEEEEESRLEDISNNLISGFLRAGDESMERVLSYTPSKVPFWHGESYASIPFMFIPRALWPEKPSRHFWNKFGRLYGVLSSEDYQTSVGVSYLAEAYMNFGYQGMYLCALFVGLLFAVVERSSIHLLGGYYYLPYMVLLTPLLPPAIDLGSMLNSLWMIYLVFIVLRPLLLQIAQRDEYS